jgi:hypothetical protein
MWYAFLSEVASADMVWHYSVKLLAGHSMGEAYFLPFIG